MAEFVWTDTFLRLLVVLLIEIFVVLFTSWSGTINDLAIISSSLGLGLVIWSEQRLKSGWSGKAIFILVVFFHLYCVGQYLWYGGSMTGQFLLFSIGISLSSSFGC